MIEIWKDVDGYEGIYKVSNRGRIKSVDRILTTKRGVEKPIKGKVLIPCNNGNGYLYVSLGRGKHEYVHVLVARAFIQNTKNNTEVNHINEVKSDNRVENLEWATRIQNIRHGTGIMRAAKARTSKLTNGKCSKPIIGVNHSDNSVIKFPSISEARRHGYDSGSIIKCCKGLKNTYKGYSFRYA